MWGQTEVRVSLSMARVAAAAVLQPLRGSSGWRTATGWAPLVHVWCHRGAMKFLGATERGKKFNLDAFLKEKATPG